MKILVVDDDPFIVSGLAKMLREFPQIECIMTAFYTDDALEKLKGNDIDILITDIKMPGASGLDLIRTAKSHNFCKYYIILTGFDKFEFAQTAVNYHVDYYLLKPVNKEELFGIVMGLIAQTNGKDIISNGITIDFSLFPKLNHRIDRVSNSAAQILQYIERNFTRDISLYEIGKVFNLHVNYICSLLKREIGESSPN